MRSWLTALCVAVLAATPALSAAQRQPESEVKAVVVVNLLSFIQWPQGTLASEREFRLCVPASTPTVAALGKLEKRSIHGLPLALRPLAGGDELRLCHAILAPSHDVAMMRAVQATQGLPVLLIGDGAGALERGAMIGVDVDSGRVVFDIDLGALRKARLSASSKLLRLVRQLVE
ncbi:MAG: YfiR family protein [Sterolibacterium sp.]|jgi:hypothetical protein